VGWGEQARVSLVAWVCVLSLKLSGLSGVVSFACAGRNNIAFLSLIFFVTV